VLPAATVTWDTSTTAGFQSGNGTWGTNAFWSADGTTLLPWVAGDAASFLGQSPAVTETITVGSSQTISGLNFGTASTSGNWILSGAGTLSLSGNANFSVVAGSTAEIRTGLVLSTNTLTKTGAGILVLSNPALTSANIRVDEGILRFKLPNPLGPMYSGGSVTINSGAEVALAANDTWGAAGTANAARVVLNGGILSSNGFFTSLNNVTLNGGTIKANGGVNSTFGSFQFSGTLLVAQNASIIQTGSNASINLHNTVFNVSAGATLDSNASFKNNANTASGQTSTLTKTGAGSLVLNGASTYTSGTSITAGTLIVGSSTALGAGGVTVSGGALNLGSFSLANTITLSGGTISGAQLNGTRLVLQSGEVAGNIVSGAVSKTGAGTVTLSGANSYGGGTTVTAGTLVVNNADALGAGSVTLAGGSLDVQAHTVAKNITLTSNSAVAGANGTISGVISGSGLLTKVGSGALTLSGNNTFAGGALVNAGTLHVNGEVLGNLVVSSGAKLAGSGIVHDVTVVAGGSINAGGVDSVGTMRADSLSLQGGAKVELNLSDASLAAGNGFDRFLLTGQLDLSAASSANKYSLILAGLPSVFDAASDYSFAFIKYGSLNLGANTNISDLFTLDVSGLKDQTGGALDVSKFSLVDDVANQQVLLNYGSPIPEPSTYGLSLGCLGLAIAAVRRRRRMTV
jgi:autotransporter-associated beta strand protein